MNMSKEGSFAPSWYRFLAELTFLKGCVLDPLPGVPDSTPPQKDFQPYIASLFYIRMVSLLDEALDQHIDSAKLPLPKGYRGRLAEKINFLESQGSLLDAAELHRIRGRRNDVAHEPQAKADWPEVESDLAVVHRELEHLGLVGLLPHYERFGERVPGQPDGPDVVIVNCFTCGVREQDKELLKLSWKVKYYDESCGRE